MYHLKLQDRPFRPIVSAMIDRTCIRFRRNSFHNKNQKRKKERYERNKNGEQKNEKYREIRETETERQQQHHFRPGR